MKWRHRPILAVVLGLALVLSLHTGVLAQQKTTITFGIPWGLDVFEGVLLQIVDEFNAQSSTVHVEIESGWGPDKLITAAAGGSGPDVVGMDNPGTVRSIGEVTLQPIDLMIDRYGIDVSRFLPDSVTQLQGRTYAIKLFVDPNFPLIYNETLFQEAALAGAPRTIQEFDELFPKMLRRSSDGMLEQALMLPWNLGEDHLFQTWGPAFGATHVWEGDENSGRFRVATPEFRATFDWLMDYYHRIAPDIAHWGDARWYHLDWLIDGKLLMAYHVSPTFRRLNEGTPYVWKIAPPMNQAGGAEVPVWFGGFTFGVGKFSQNVDAAYEFLNFLVWDERAAEIIGRTGLIGAYQGSVAHEVLMEAAPEWGEFLALLPRASGNYYVPPQVPFGPLTQQFVQTVKAGGSVPSGLADLERVLNANAAEVGILAE